MDAQSAHFADRLVADHLVKEAGRDPAALVNRAFRLAVARPPTARESVIALDYLNRQRQACSDLPAEAAERTALARLRKLVPNLNEFVYVD